MATLGELLTEKEKNTNFLLKNLGYINIDSDIRDLTIGDISQIAFTLIKTEYPNKVPECYLPSEAINILFRRAEKLGIGIN